MSVALLVVTPADSWWIRPSPYRHRPRCNQGDAFFKDYLKCDASVHYCFEYRNDSCVGKSMAGCE